jgi:hypothetical protein
MKRKLLDVNVFVRDLACRLSSVADRGTIIRTMLSQGQLEVMIDPEQMAEGFAALIREVCGAVERGCVITIKTALLRFHKSRDIDGETGCVFICVSLRHRSHILRHEGSVRSIFRIVKQHGGSVRTFDAGVHEEQLNIYLPISSASRSSRWNAMGTAERPSVQVTRGTA